MWLSLSVPVKSTINAFNRKHISLQEKHVYSDAFSGPRDTSPLSQGKPLFPEYVKYCCRTKYLGNIYD